MDRVIQYFCDAGLQIMTTSLSQIVAACDVSPATVVRVCQHLGYAGLKEYRIALAKESARPLQPSVTITPLDPDIAIIEKVLQGCMASLQASASTLNASNFTDAVEALKRASNIDIYAVGGSVPIASYFRHQLMKLGIRSSVYMDDSTIRLSFAQRKENEVVIGMSCSGATENIVSSLLSAKKLHATTIALTNFPLSPLGQAADILLVTSGDPFWENDLNTYSRLAQLAVVDMLYAALAVRMHKK